MGKYKFPHTTPPRNSNFLTPTNPIPVNKEFPVFSFKHFEHQHGKFGKGAIKTKEDWQELIHGLHKVSQITWGQIKENPRMYHAHEISVTKHHKPKYIDNLPTILENNSPFQFKSHDECRIIGFFDKKAVFQIFWFDRDHEIYPE